MVYENDYNITDGYGEEELSAGQRILAALQSLRNTEQSTERGEEKRQALLLGVIPATGAALVLAAGYVRVTAYAVVDTRLGVMYQSPRLLDWLIVGFVMVASVAACAFVAVRFNESQKAQAERQMFRAKEIEQKAGKLVDELRHALDAEKRLVSDFEMDKLINRNTLASLRKQLRELRRMVTKLRQERDEAQRSLQAIEGVEFCSLDSWPHRRAVIGYFKQCGLSQSEVESQLFGYTGGQAWRIVKNLWDKV